jgi:ribose transport system ATP-binding protein
LSGGIQQKVALGHWLSLKPLVVILDQPTPEIDTEGKKEICDLIADLKLTFTVSVKGGMDESI